MLQSVAPAEIVFLYRGRAKLRSKRTRRSNLPVLNGAFFWIWMEYARICSLKSEWFYYLQGDCIIPMNDNGNMNWILVGIYLCWQDHVIINYEDVMGYKRNNDWNMDRICSWNIEKPIIPNHDYYWLVWLNYSDLTSVFRHWNDGTCNDASNGNSHSERAFFQVSELSPFS